MASKKVTRRVTFDDRISSLHEEISIIETLRVKLEEGSLVVDNHGNFMISSAWFHDAARYGWSDDTGLPLLDQKGNPL